MEKKEPIPKEHNHKETADFARSRLPSEDDLFELAELFKIFSDSTRIRIMCALSETEMCVYDIADLLGASQSAVAISCAYCGPAIWYGPGGMAKIFFMRWTTTT